MLLRKLLFLAPLVAMGIATSASAQAPGDETNWIDATLMDVDAANRTITVRFEENNETRSYPVAEDADIVRNDGKMDVNIPLSQMHEGSEIRLEFDGLPGEETLSKVTEHALSDSDS